MLVLNLSSLIVLISINCVFANEREENVIEISLTTKETTVSEETTSVPKNDQNDVNRVPTDRPIRTTTKSRTNEIDSPKYIRGYFGGYYLVDIDDTKFYVHGKYQKPVFNYYGNYKHNLNDHSTLGYYLGFAMRKLDHNEYFQHNNFTHYDIHHFYVNSSMLPEQFIGSDNIVFCAPNTLSFCPENTESLCLRNSAVWCVTRTSHVKTCEKRDCVRTRMPCVKSDDPQCVNSMEYVKLPCISTIIIRDVNEDKHGLTFNNVAGTFILAPVPPVDERKYCVTIVAEPRKNL